ncbi:hypothetical protein AK812_SmicGene48819 [Symbiodinium microadriaticum]|uniref:Uncharacterized protein n=1 Tax=Symbiodinium microadriaticum TaxID=2951 RepID=A0A1Q8ZK38_SYMMI|nr:hypothetical protein AK812_SmicGene48819 [Symbiodinium microadriaticum]
MLPVLLLWLGVQEALAGKGLDTCTGVVEEDWFHACDHMTELSVWVAKWSSSGAQDLHGLDMFGASCRFQSELERRGLPCGVYDIALNPAHDLLGRTGFKDALQLGLRPGWSKLVADSAPFPRADQEISGGLASRMHGAVCRLRADGVILAGPPCIAAFSQGLVDQSIFGSGGCHWGIPGDVPGHAWAAARECMPIACRLCSL